MTSLQNTAIKEVSRHRFFYGWVIVGVSFTALLIRFGVLATFSVFLVALVKEFGWNRGAISGAQTLVMIMLGIGGPLTGYCIQRWGARKTITISALFLGLALALTSQVKQLWQFYLLWGFLVGLGHSFQSMVPWTVAVSRWFIKKRGVAMGIAMSGIGVGYFIIVPVTQYFISTFDWKVALLIVGGMITLGIAPMSALLLREKPEDMNLLPDGEAVQRKRGPEKQEHKTFTDSDTGCTVRQALKTPAFWFICLGFAAILFTTNIILAHQVAFMVDAGYKASFAAFIFGVFGLTSLPSRIIWGAVTDRIGPILTYTLSTLILLGGIFALLIIRSPSQSLLPFVFALLWGCSYGTTIVIVAVLSANLFQGKNFSVIFGFVTLIGQVLGSPGAWFGGYLFDLTGNYNMAFISAMLSAALSCALIWGLKIVKRNESGKTVPV